MTPASPAPNHIKDEIPINLPSPVETLDIFDDSLRLRANTLPPTMSPGGDRGPGLLTEAPVNSWSPTKGSWLPDSLGPTPKENPYDRLQTRDTYIASSDSSVATSPTTPSILVTPTFPDPPTPMLTLAEAFGEMSHDNEIASHDPSEEELLIERR